MGLVAEEADESQGWLEFIDEARLIASAAELARLLQEATELCAIMSASYATARFKEHERKRKRKT